MTPLLYTLGVVSFVVAILVSIGLHEFGHLVHHVLGGQGGWVRFSGVATEWDFVEAPSQMLEEWAWDADVLATFARNDDGKTIPAELVAAMRRAAARAASRRGSCMMILA